ncbi:site-specific integrase [Paenibacillus sp. FSL F4-0236]|uniref:tyrosine-type recombinase/integrase n=1 Tax=unclassified Paenibacillus TaxID=185978 RepID=UPI0030F578CA
MELSDLEFFLEDFLDCQNKNLSRKTVNSYEQSLKLFVAYLKNQHDVDKVKEVRVGHIRQYIAYLQERGKYTVVNRESSKLVNFPENRVDFKKEVSSITINNYIRNIKVFFNWLKQEGELLKNPVENISQIKTVRRQKKGISQEEFNGLIEKFDYTKFHGYLNKIIVLLLQDILA